MPVACLHSRKAIVNMGNLTHEHVNVGAFNVKMIQTMSIS